MNFCSDNVAGMAPEILEAINQANKGASKSYGADEFTKRLDHHLSDVFERKVRAYPLVTGTAANALALGVMTPPFGAIYCHEESHIMVDECGAPEMFTGGAKLIPLHGANGKIKADDLHKAVELAKLGDVHHVQPAAVSITQATEAGTSYRVDEIGAISEVARRHHLKLHMDGARFANALVHLGVAAKKITWEAGVDALSFGATKNGAMAAEMVVFFNEELAETFAYRRKRAGHLISKMRFVSAQLDAYLSDGLWLKLARHANAAAQRLAQGLGALPGARLLYPVEANEIFVRLPLETIAGLRAAGFDFYDWPGAEPGTIRLVTAFDTPSEAVERFLRTVQELGSRAAE